MSLWGNQDSKTATGTVAIDAAGIVTGTSTLLTTEAKIGNYIRVGTEDYVIITITSATVALVRAGVQGATLTACAASAYTLSEKPASVAVSESGSTSGVSGDSTKVYGVDVTEQSAGGDNVVAISVVNGGSAYLVAPTVVISGGGGSSAAATATISGGAVTAIAVTNGGSSYETVPTVTVAKPTRIIPTSGITIATDTIAYTAHGLSAGDAVVYNNGGGTSATGLTSGTTYYVIASGLTANAFKVSATGGGSTVDITGTGNNAQYFEIQAVASQATATAAKGTGFTDGVNTGIGHVTHAGWVRRTVGTGNRAGRVQYETLVASGSIIGDQSDDIEFPDA